MSYTFLPWLREGASADLAAAAGGRNRVQTLLQLRVNDTPIKELKLRLLGPGDVLGFDQQLVVRTDPPQLARGVEPNYFPFVEFRVGSFPWLFTPEAPDANNRLRPWICLVVVRHQDGVCLGVDPASKMPLLTIQSPAVPGSELPDLAESWAWAHVQVTGKASREELRRVHTQQPERVVARLLCPRRLQPAAAYHACVVPAFAAGVAAALDPTRVDDDAGLADAWTADAEQVILPVYYHWEFTTGEAGDFERLARALHGGPAPAGVGRRTLDLGKAGLDVPDRGETRVEFEGALRVPHDDQPDTAEPAPAPDWFATHLAGLLAATDPDRVQPPLYGGLQAGVTTLPAAGWLRQLNLDARHRTAAGLGARIVREQQEQLMQAAWAQAGALEAANQLLARSQLARAVGASVHRQRLAPLAADNPKALLQLAASVRLPSGSLRAGVHARPRLADATLDPAFRRLSRPRGPLARRFANGAPMDRLFARQPPGMHADQVPDGLALKVVDELAPDKTHRNRVAYQLQAPDQLRLMDRPDPLAPIVHAPQFPAPMAVQLQRLSVDYLLAGAEHVPPDTVLLLAPNRPFIAAFLAGLNHEMSRELLWREYPTDLVGTYFRVFWDRRGQAAITATPDDLADIPPINQWDPDGNLGAQVRGDPKGELVLVVRSELLRRYPRAVVSAVKAAGTKPQRVLADQSDPANHKPPRFTGFIDPDLGLFGFDLSEADARGDRDGLGWFFVFQEQPSEPRFGLDESGWLDDPPSQPVPNTNRQVPALAIDDLAWGHLVSKDELPSLTHAPITEARPAGWQFYVKPEPPRPVQPSDLTDLGWAGGAADVARLTLQRPVRVALHAELLLPRRR